MPPLVVGIKWCISSPSLYLGRFCLLHAIQVMELLNLDQLPDRAAAARLQLWRFRESVTFQRFKTSFELINKRTESQFPVIAAVLKYEHRLSLVKYTADIFAWQALLFKYLKSGSVNRQEAAETTNAYFIDNMVPQEEQQHAFEVLDRFCVAFNATITQPDPLIECAPNIFVFRGEVDLQQARGETVAGLSNSMTRHTALSFSLPNRNKKSSENFNSITGKWGMVEEFVDPRGLCTIAILNFLQVCPATFLQPLWSLYHETL